MSEAPTVVGSIMARLKMDASDWDATIREAKVKAGELGRLNPTLKVDADIATALAKLEAVREAAARVGGVSTPDLVPAGAVAKIDAVVAAERRLAAAESASESATARAVVAEMKFEESRDKHNRTAAQVAAAELAVSEAIKRSENAALRAVAAEEALAAAQRKAAEAAVVEAAAQDVNTAATVKANQANSTNASRVGMIASAVAVLLPMMVPLAAFTVGAAGALTLMGVSGVLAVKGIHDEMLAGTAVGARYSEGVQSLKTNMDSLSHTAALAMLSSFMSITGDLNSNMPALNRQVKDFTGFLGRTGANFFTGAISGAQVLEPLMLSVAVYVERLSAGFKAWTTDGGLQKFGDYALGVLPQVEQTLGALSSAIMHILEALAPLGGVGLGALTAVSDAINAIPVEVLSNIIGAATAGFLAFKTWGLIAPILSSVASAIGLVGTATTIATGPIGWIVAGIGALIAVFAIATASANANRVATAAYAGSLMQDGNVIGTATRAQAAKNLQDAQAFTLAKQLGVSTKTVTDATLGKTSAIKELNAVTDKANTLNGELHKGGIVAGADNQKRAADALHNAKAAETLNGIIGVQSGAIKAQIGVNKELQEGISGVTSATNTSGESVATLAKRYGMTKSAYLAAVDSGKQTAAQLGITTQAMFVQGDAAGLLKQSLDLLNGKTLSAASAQNQFDSQLANMADHMDASGKQIDRANTLLDGNTAAAVKNRGELIGLTQAAQSNAQAFRDNGGSAEDTRAKLISMKSAIEENAVAHGEDRDKVHAYLEEIYKIPETVPPTKLEVDAAAALATLALVQGAIARTTRNISIAVELHGAENLATTGGLKVAFATGGTVGGTGTGDTVAAMLTPGEEVIKPLPAAKYRPLLKAINSDTVGDYLKHSPGLTTSGTSATVAGSVRTPAPAATIAAPAAPAGNVSVSIINKAGTALADLIELSIQTASGKRKIDLSTGMQKAAY